MRRSPVVVSCVSSKKPAKPKSSPRVRVVAKRSRRHSRCNPICCFSTCRCPISTGSACSKSATVFVTAFDQYAVRAFDVHAVDYLLKPFDTGRFREAFARAKERVSGQSRGAEDERIRALLNDYVAASKPQASRQPLDRVAVKVDGVLKIVRTSDVDWWETDGNYMRLHVGGGSHLIRMTAASIEPQLDPRAFIRIHRRYIVNVDRIVEVQPWFAGDAIVVLRNGAKLRLSRTYRERLHARLGARGELAETAATTGSAS
jgi:two-component system, LytTR family, response regulator